MRRLLFIAPTPLGDALLTTGVLRHFIERDQPDEVHVVCGPVSAPIFSTLTPHVTVVKKQKYSRHWIDIWRGKVTLRWHRVIDMRGSLLPYLLASRYRHRFIRLITTEHKVEQIAKCFKIPASSFDLGPWCNEDHQKEIIPYLATPLLCLAPFATWVGKEWPLERFLDLAQRLTDAGGPLEGAAVVLMGAPNERERSESFIARWPKDRPLHNLVGAISLPALFLLLKQAQLAVCNDSGLMHLAAASGIPTIGLFGPSPDHLYAPWGPSGLVIRAHEDYKTLVRHARAGVAGSLLKSITVDDVFEKIQKKLTKTP